MLKFIIFELLKSYFTREKKCYGNYLVNIFAGLCLISLIAANFFFFYLEDSAAGYFIICSTAFLLIAMILKAYSRYSGQEAGGQLPSLMVTGAEKMMPYMPALIRFVPVSLVTFAAWNLLKSRLMKFNK